MVEQCLNNDSDEIITFCVQVPEQAIIKKDISAIDFLKMVKSTYENWVLPGTAIPESSPGLTHNVSNTVTVKPEEWNKVIEFIYENRYYFSGISLLADYGDKLYKQAPMEKIQTIEDIEKWNKLVSSYKPVDWSKFNEEEDETTIGMTVACSGGNCELNY